MSTFYNISKININKININYRKMKINHLIKNNKFIIFFNVEDILFIKNKLLNNNIPTLILKKKYVKSLFNFFSFLFLEGESFFLIFLNNVISFLDIINYLENKNYIYIYKNSFSNYISSSVILSEYKKYNNVNFIYFNFIKIKIKITILLYFLSILFIKNIK